MNMKKIVSLFSAIIMSILLAMPVSAITLSDGTKWEMDDEIIVEYREELHKRGLSEENIQTLAHLSICLDEMVQLTDEELMEIFLGQLGRNTLPRIFVKNCATILQTSIL